MASWNGTPIPSAPEIKIPNSIPQSFNWNSYLADPKGSFNKFKGAREINRLNWKGYFTASGNSKKTILSSPSRKFISDAMKQVRSLRKAKKMAEQTKAVADKAQKANELTEKIHKALFRKIPGSNFLDSASRVGSILGILSAIGLVVLVKFQEFVSGRIFDDLSRTQLDLTKINQTAVNAAIKLKTIDSKIQKLEKELDTNAKDYSRLNKQQEAFGREAVEIKKKVNDVTYETREGRKITTGLVDAARKLANDALYEFRQNKATVDSKISEAKKQANDALYEARQGRNILESKIQEINSKITDISSKIATKFQAEINTTIANIQANLKQASFEQSKTKEGLGTLQNVVGTIQSTLKSFDTKIVDLKSSFVQIVNGKVQPLEIKQQETENKTKVTLTTIEGSVTGLKQTYQLSFEAQAAKWNAEMMKLQGKVGDIETVTQSSGYKSATADLAKDLNLLKQDIPKIKNDVETNKADITKIDKKVTEQAKVNDQALPKLDQILGILPFIPARAAAAIRPDIPETYAQAVSAIRDQAAIKTFLQSEGNRISFTPEII